MSTQKIELMKKNFKATERYEEYMTLCLKECCDENPESLVDAAKSSLLFRPSSENAVCLLKKAAESGNTDAMLTLGLCFEFGLGTVQNQKYAYQWFKKAADMGSSSAAVLAAHQCECNLADMEPDYKTAFELYNKAAKLGNTTAQFRLALYYERGNGTGRNEKEAFRWCKTAAEAGHTRAKHVLGRYYEYGIGTEISIPAAIRCYEQAAAQKNIHAQAALARLRPETTVNKVTAQYMEAIQKLTDALKEKYDSEKVDKCLLPEYFDDAEANLIAGLRANCVKNYCAYSYVTAFEFFLKAAKHNIPEALWYVADYYMSGKYTQRNPEQAYKLFKRAAEMGYIPAIWALGFFCGTGIVAEKNSEKMLECWKTAAASGYGPAVACLAVLYETGTYVDEDFEKSEQLYALAEKERSPLEAWAELDKYFSTVNSTEILLQYCIYRYEELRSRDSSKFFGAYTRLADSGCVYAMRRLAHMYEEGTSKSAVRPDKAFYYYNKANEAGYTSVKSEFEEFCKKNPTAIAKHYEKNRATDGGTEKAFSIYLAAAKTGDTSAMLHIAKSYLNGTGTEQDEDEAYRWACRAHHLGEAVTLNLGRHLIHYPPEVSEDKLVSYFLEHRELLSAQYSLGMCYETGFGTAKDKKKAAALYYSAASKDYRWAHFALARCYEKGIGVRKNTALAAEQYLYSITENDPVATEYFSDHFAEYNSSTDRNDSEICLCAICTEKGIGTTEDKEKALEMYRELADKGYIPAAYLLGKCCEEGIGKNTDIYEAYEYYKTAASKSFPPAMCAIGRFYENGIAIPTQKQKATLWYKAACDLGCAYAFFRLGHMQYSADKSRVPEYIYAAADSELSEAQLFLGKHFEENGNIKQAFEWYRRASLSGSSDADVAMGRYYLKTGKEEDRHKAFELFSRASRRNNADAMLEAAECIARGLGVQKNPSSAVKFYLRAALAGNMYAQYSLGSCYERGFGTEINLKKAVEYYSMAAENGHSDAQYALGSCYAKEKRITQNMPMAIYWYEQSVAQENDKAGTALGICYENGQGGLKVDMNRAMALYIMSAQKGNYIAQYRLGMCYEKGRFVEADPKQAFAWYLKSAEAGNSVAQYKVGECFETGFGTERNMAAAVEWYQKAAVKSEEAAYRLGLCFEYGYGVEANKQVAAEWYAKARSGSNNVNRKSKKQ